MVKTGEQCLQGLLVTQQRLLLLVQLFAGRLQLDRFDQIVQRLDFSLDGRLFLWMCLDHLLGVDNVLRILHQLLGGGEQLVHVGVAIDWMVEDVLHNLDLLLQAMLVLQQLVLHGVQVMRVTDQMLGVLRPQVDHERLNFVGLILERVEQMMLRVVAIFAQQPLTVGDQLLAVLD